MSMKQTRVPVASEEAIQRTRSGRPINEDIRNLVASLTADEQVIVTFDTEKEAMSTESRVRTLGKALFSGYRVVALKDHDANGKAIPNVRAFYLKATAEELQVA